VIETVNGHTDVIHYQYRQLPLWGCGPQPSPRDLCVQRYWRRDSDGSYIILLRSREHPQCPPRPGYVRATLLGGGFVISPLPRQGAADTVRPDSLIMQIIEMVPGGWLPPRSPVAYVRF